MSTPAVLGGPAAFPDGMPIARPFVPPLDRVTRRLAPSYESGILTNGALVAELEEATAEFLGVEHVVAVASCTSGLMLVLRALAPRGPVLLPSFTFSASAHSVVWNHREPRFVECDPDTFQLDVADAAQRSEGAGAVLATHVFGAPCPVEEVEQLAETAGVPAVFDAAHAFGAEHCGRRVGAGGAAEVFSLTPTKILVAGEGGLVATNRDDVAQAVRWGRDYGNPGDYDTRFVGLNARLSELHAALALEGLVDVPSHLERRRALAARYRDGLGAIPGLVPQRVGAADASTYKDFTIAVDAQEFGLSRDQVVRALAAEGVQTRCYFDPPVHRQQAYAGVRGSHLPVTERTASRVVSLPMFGELNADAVDTITDRLGALHASAAQVRSTLAR